MRGRSSFIDVAARAYQRGSVLVVALIFLLLLSIVGLGAMQSSTLQERMAGNSRDMNTAFQAAEAALREAETYLTSVTLGTFTSTGTDGRYACTAGTECIPDWADSSSTGWKAKTGTALNSVHKTPEYVIRRLPPIADPSGSLVSDQPASTLEIYEITARGFGTSGESAAVVRTLYRRS